MPETTLYAGGNQISVLLVVPQIKYSKDGGSQVRKWNYVQGERLWSEAPDNKHRLNANLTGQCVHKQRMWVNISSEQIQSQVLEKIWWHGPPSAIAPDVLQVVREEWGEGKVGDKLKPGSTNLIPDVDPTQLVETPWRTCRGFKNKKYHCQGQHQEVILQRLIPSNDFSKVCVWPPGGASWRARWLLPSLRLTSAPKSSSATTWSVESRQAAACRGVSTPLPTLTLAPEGRQQRR